MGFYQFKVAFTNSNSVFMILLVGTDQTVMIYVFLLKTRPPAADRHRHPDGAGRGQAGRAAPGGHLVAVHVHGGGGAGHQLRADRAAQPGPLRQPQLHTLPHALRLQGGCSCR